MIHREFIVQTLKNFVGLVVVLTIVTAMALPALMTIHALVAGSAWGFVGIFAFLFGIAGVITWDDR